MLSTSAIPIFRCNYNLFSAGAQFPAGRTGTAPGPAGAFCPKSPKAPAIPRVFWRQNGLVFSAKIEYNKELDESKGNPLACEERKVPTKIQTEKGSIRLTSDVYSNLTGAVATSCYGVKGMAFRSKTDGLVHLLRRESMSKGVKIVYNDDQSISIYLHIIVDNGVNLVAVGQSIQNEVKYNVHRLTGVEVRSVNVCVDSMVIG